ncbi:MAG: GFA family protein [Arenicella sp.]
MMELPITGGCSCGDIRYEAASGPEFSLMCQCRQCQRITGTGHAAQFVVPTISTRVEGELNYFQYTADSEHKVDSGFCGRCGNPVLKKTTGHPQWLFFHAATLDEPAQFVPDRVVWQEQGQPWDILKQED